MNLFIQNVFSDPVYYGIWLLVVIFSICIHEFCHAYVALREGDDTAAMAGHLTLNPLKQMGPFSLIMLAFIGIAWGAVPVNPMKMRSKWSHARVAFAGPFANLLLFVLGSVGAALVLVFTDPESGLFKAFTIFIMLSELNLVLFLFNMLPVYPFDGWTVFTTFIPVHRIKQETLAILSVGVVILVFSLFGYVWGFAEMVSQTAIEKMAYGLLSLTSGNGG